MSKKIFAALSLFLSLSAQSQIREILEAAKPKKVFEGIPVLQKKSQVLSISAGTPNKVSNFLNFGGIAPILFNNTIKKSIGPFMLDYEYMINDNFGLGLSLLYASGKQTYSSSLFSDSYIGSINQFQIGLSTYYHIYTTDKLDPYVKGTVGVNLWNGSYKDNNGNEIPGKNFTAPTPFGLRTLIGLRYFAGKSFAVIGEGNFTVLPKPAVTANIGVAMKLK
jgi:Outer membrane protein beta-barrel domain